MSNKICQWVKNGWELHEKDVKNEEKGVKMIVKNVKSRQRSLVNISLRDEKDLEDVKWEVGALNFFISCGVKTFGEKA